jgi:hypothetical protein
VVSWNDAAGMNDSVESDPFVIPNSSVWADAGRPPALITRSISFEEPELVHLLLGEEPGVAQILDLHALHHLPRDGLDVLVVNVDALDTGDPPGFSLTTSRCDAFIRRERLSCGPRLTN